MMMHKKLNDSDQENELKEVFRVFGKDETGEAEILVIFLQKSVNLQYNTLVCWADGTNVLLTERLMFQVFFFHKILQNSLQKSFQFIFLFFL